MASAPHITTEQLRGINVFDALPDATLDWLLHAGTLRQLAPRERLSAQERNADESYCFILRGVLAITLDEGQPEKPTKKASLVKRPPKERKYLGYFESGACFSSAFVRNQEDAPAWSLDCIAANAVTLLEVERARLVELFAHVPAFRQQLAQRITSARSHFLTQQDPTQSVVQDFFLRENYVTSSVVRVGRLDRCIDCNKCHDACAERHGVARMARFGPTLGRLTFHVVCRTCSEQPCIPVCKSQSIRFDSSSQEVKISDDCTGCGLCAKYCPNDAITMVPRPGLDESSRGPKKRAVKCDHCDGYADRACLTSCPTGALIEVDAVQLFKGKLLDSAGPAARTSAAPAPKISEAPFLEGVKSPAARQRLHDSIKTWCAVVTVLLLGWIGIECFLIRTQPEHSLLHHFVKATGSSFPVSFTSGRGIGHWLGYIGTGGMLASVLYSLRTRVNWFKRFGSQTGWLSAHLWLGFVGATLVTYHAAFKLDRWASIACYLMWAVIVTGIVGRYAFGRVHTAVNLAELELDALRDKCRGFAVGCATPHLVRTLLGDDSREGRKRWALAVMLWEELRDRVALLQLAASGTRHLSTPNGRREMRRCFADWAAQRRRSSYYQSAKTILRHWNIVHIVLAIAMFILAGIHVVYGFLYKAV